MHTLYVLCMYSIKYSTEYILTSMVRQLIINTKVNHCFNRMNYFTLST